MRMILATVAAAAISTSATAQETKPVEQVVTQPLSDINVKRKDVPLILDAALADPYSMDGIKRCGDIIEEVEKLDAALGPDFDTRTEPTRGDKRRKSAMQVAGGVVNSFIPFRFLIREISGANKSDDAYQSAAYAGIVRRGFLKGIGLSRRCKPPGSPAPRPVEPPPMSEEERAR